MKQLYIFILSLLLCSCADRPSSKPLPNEKAEVNLDENSTTLVVLGTIQDAGSPHIACQRECCRALFLDTSIDRRVVSLGLVDNPYNKKYLFEATPNITRQLKTLVQASTKNRNEIVDGIFLTHAHIGHYIGLMYLGKEATNAKNVPVFAMPKMRNFLSTNGPWDQLVSNNNIQLQTIENERAVVLTPNVTVTPFLVPHRDEYSETVGYKIQGPSKSALFIPDIDKWERWGRNIDSLVA
ncbi:MAG: MBL fold metallo-hydrolase, partial [Bacteroidota bacterium]